MHRALQLAITTLITVDAQTAKLRGSNTSDTGIAQLDETRTKCYDKALWPDMGKDCGGCQALVLNLDSKYSGTCDAYCRSFGLPCSSAGEAAAGSCTVRSPSSCTRVISNSSSAVCSCHGGYDRCQTHRWPDAKSICSSCQVLLDHAVLAKKYKGSCADYCKKLAEQPKPLHGLYWDGYGTASWDYCFHGGNFDNKIPRLNDAVCRCTHADRL